MIISLIVTVFAFLLIIVSVLAGLKKGTIKSSVKAGKYLISALLAFLLAKPISNLFSGLSDFVVKLIEKNVEGFSDITEASPTLVQLITKLPVALFTPILFVILFYVFRLIIGIILKLSLKPVYKLDPCNLPPLASDSTEEQVEKRKSSVRCSLWIGRGISIVPGLVLVFVLFLPIAGYLNMASDTMDAIVVATENEAKTESNIQMLSNIEEDNDSSELKEINDDYIKPVNDNIFIKMVYGAGGRASFNTMTSFKLGEDKVSISSEIAILSTATSNIMVLTDKPVKEYTKEQTDAIVKLTEQFENSVILPKISAEIISDASDNWLNNEEFFGIKKPSISTTMDPLLNKVLNIFKTETNDTIKDDLNTLADIFVILIDNDILNSVDNQEKLLESLAKEGLITSLLTKITENNRMAILTNEITNMGVRAIATTLKIPEDKIAVHKEVVDSIKNNAVNVINSNLTDEEKVTELATNLNTVFVGNGMDVSDEITPIIAQSIVDNFKEQNEISSDEINDYFIMLSGIYLDESQQNTIVNKQTQSPFVYLATTESPDVVLCGATKIYPYESFLNSYEKNKDKFKSDRYKLKDNMTIRDLYNRTSKELNLIYNTTEQIKEKGDKANPDALISLATPAELKTSTKTIQDLMITVQQPIINKSNVKEEGKKLENIMIKSSVVVYSIGNMNKAKEEGKNSLEAVKDFDFNAMGSMLDILGSTVAFKSSTASIAESMLDKVTGQKTNLISEMKKNESNYTDLFKSVGDTTQVILGATDDQLSDEEKFQNIQTLMNNLTPGNANIISNIVSPKLLKEQGVPEQYTQKTSDMVKQLFKEMSQVEAANVEAEANAVKYLFDIGMAAKQSSTTPLFGENGKIKNTNDFINRCLTSTVVTNTLETTTYDENNSVILDPVGVKSKISDANQNEVITALNKYITDNSITSANTETVKDIVAMAAMFNIETQVGTSIVFVAK